MPEGASFGARGRAECAWVRAQGGAHRLAGSCSGHMRFFSRGRRAGLWPALAGAAERMSLEGGDARGAATAW